jgi:hypothetical protein
LKIGDEFMSFRTVAGVRLWGPVDVFDAEFRGVGKGWGWGNGEWSPLSSALDSSKEAI